MDALDGNVLDRQAIPVLGSALEEEALASASFVERGTRSRLIGNR